ncbi:MAG TPA: SAM-dependent methyltransferase, partial [Kocuria sp.]|nr:SAM-dependent methyltransferase [Kocuria sp.]
AAGDRAEPAATPAPETRAADTEAAGMHAVEHGRGADGALGLTDGRESDGERGRDD